MRKINYSQPSNTAEERHIQIEKHFTIGRHKLFSYTIVSYFQSFSMSSPTMMFSLQLFTLQWYIQLANFISAFSPRQIKWQVKCLHFSFCFNFFFWLSLVLKSNSFFFVILIFENRIWIGNHPNALCVILFLLFFPCYSLILNPDICIL